MGNHHRAGVLVTTFTKKKMENENSDYVCLEYEINRKISKEDFENLSAGSINLSRNKDANKLESIKNWTISTYKCSRQALFEKLGKTSRTVDTELETQIETLRDTQRKYANILRLARALTSHFYHVIQTQVSISKKKYY